MRFREVVRMGLEEYYDEMKRAVDGLSYEERRFMPGPNSHHVDFAVWHIARVEDAWINRFAKQTDDQVWGRGSWADRLNLPVKEIPGFGPESGWGWSGEQVRDMPASDMSDLWAYLDAVRADTMRYLDSIDESDLDRCPDAKQPTYSIGRMWSHLLVEESQHVGQIAYLRGLQRGLNS
jgi:uncharacterized damage-inducible protein DinB